MALQFKLPDIGEGVAEGEIVKWLVKEGDVVAEHQAVVEVMTDKATVEIPSPAAGKILKRLAKDGDVVPVGSVIFELETSGPAPAQKSHGHAAPAPAPAARPATAKPSSAPAVAPAAAPARAAAHAPAPAMPASGGGRLEFKLPDIGEGVAEGEIVKWLVKLGDTVAEHQAIVEVMTDKATVEIPAPAPGKVVALGAQAGEVVAVGTVIFVLETAGATSVKGVHAPAHAPAAASAVAAPARELVTAGAPAAGAGAESSATSDKVLAVPSARRLAREIGVDLGRVRGSGRNGVVRRADVETFARSAAPASSPVPSAPSAPGRTAAVAQPAGVAPAKPAAAPVSFAAGERETRIPFRGVRRKIAEAMVRSKFTAPHFTVVEEVDVTELVKLRETAKGVGAEQGVKVTFMPFIMKAVALGLAKHPMLNAHLDEAAQELVRYGYVNLGIAMDTDNGLIVPVVKDVQGKGILQLAAELNELAERTRAGKVKPDELKGSTFSITNAGNIGGILATPIINFPDVAILGVHRIMKRPGVVETPQGDKIEVRQYMNFSCSVDHRLADGADGARFLVYLKKLLENPGLLAL
ncbi:MAG: 2-oxo acid dehydrogenase subunit E2 [Planctomycetes bacterium]|nr:2-oxo acid dehydrogenase subunit E2 [Planctomycetota bacterium]